MVIVAKGIVCLFHVFITVNNIYESKTPVIDEFNHILLLASRVFPFYVFSAKCWIHHMLMLVDRNLVFICFSQNGGLMIDG